MVLSRGHLTCQTYLLPCRSTDPQPPAVVRVSRPRPHAADRVSKVQRTRTPTRTPTRYTSLSDSLFRTHTHSNTHTHTHTHTHKHEICTTRPAPHLPHIRQGSDRPLVCRRFDVPSTNQRRHQPSLLPSPPFCPPPLSPAHLTRIAAILTHYRSH